MNLADNTPKKHLPEALAKNMWPKGVSGNPLGRPKGSISAIGEIKRIFEEDPEQFKDFINKYLKDPRNRQHIVEMLDGKPKGSNVEVNVGGDHRQVIAILGGRSNTKCPHCGGEI